MIRNTALAVTFALLAAVSAPILCELVCFTHAEAAADACHESAGLGVSAEQAACGHDAAGMTAAPAAATAMRATIVANGADLALPAGMATPLALAGAPAPQRHSRHAPTPLPVRTRPILRV